MDLNISCSVESLWKSSGSHSWALLGCIDPFLIIGKESGNSRAKSESHDVSIARCESV